MKSVINAKLFVIKNKHFFKTKIESTLNKKLTTFKNQINPNLISLLLLSKLLTQIFVLKPKNDHKHCQINSINTYPSILYNSEHTISEIISVTKYHMSNNC